MDKLIEPFESMDELLSFCYLSEKYSDRSISFKTQIINQFLQKKLTENQIENFVNKMQFCPNFYPKNFFNNQLKLDDFLAENSSKLMEPTLNECLMCKNYTLEPFKTSNSIVYSLSDGPFETKVSSKKCLKCHSIYYFSFYIDKNGERVFYSDVLKNRYISFTNETIFEIRLLENVTIDIIFKHSSFKSYTNSYNYFNFTKDFRQLNGREKLEKKRLIENWFYYRYLFTFMEIYPFKKIQAFYINLLDENLDLLNKSLFQHFAKKWSGTHHFSMCKDKNCAKSISVDGNHKVNRLKCLYEENIVSFRELGIYFI